MVEQGINATVEILPTVKCQVDLGRILGINSFNLQKVLEMDPAFLKASSAIASAQFIGSLTVGSLQPQAIEHAGEAGGLCKIEPSQGRPGHCPEWVPAHASMHARAQSLIPCWEDARVVLGACGTVDEHSICGARRRTGRTTSTTSA